MLNKEEINRVFHETQLEDNYNFLEDDLVKLANAYIAKVKPMIVKECVDIASAYNTKVAEKIDEVMKRK